MLAYLTIRNVWGRTEIVIFLLCEDIVWFGMMAIDRYHTLYNIFHLDDNDRASLFTREMIYIKFVAIGFQQRDWNESIIHMYVCNACIYLPI